MAKEQRLNRNINEEEPQIPLVCCGVSCCAGVAAVAFVTSCWRTAFGCAMLCLPQPVLGKQDLVQGPDLANGVKLEVNAPKLALCALQPPCPVPRPLGSLSAWRGRWGPPRDDHPCEHRHQNHGGVVAMGAGVLQPEPPKADGCCGAAS